MWNDVDGKLTKLKLLEGILAQRITVSMTVNYLMIISFMKFSLRSYKQKNAN